MSGEDYICLLVFFQEGVLFDVYPISVVNDTKAGIMGSCATYKSRINITSDVKELENSCVKIINERSGKLLLLHIIYLIFLNNENRSANVSVPNVKL